MTYSGSENHPVTGLKTPEMARPLHNSGLSSSRPNEPTLSEKTEPEEMKPEEMKPEETEPEEESILERIAERIAPEPSDVARSPRENYGKGD